MSRSTTALPLFPRPANAWPIAPRGFKVELYATGLDNPRLLRTAPNGDLFLAESETGKIKVFRGVGADGKAKQVSVFAAGLHQPFGIAFYPQRPQSHSGLTSATPTASFASPTRTAT